MRPSLRSFRATRPTDLIQLECPLNSRVAQDRRFQQHDYTLFHSAELAYVQRLRDVPDKSHRVALELSQNSDVTGNASGALFGAADWSSKRHLGTGRGEYRRVAHFPTDGVIKSPPADGIDATIDG